MPSAEEFLLPQRAYLLSFKSQAATARRHALDDSRAAFDQANSHGHRHQAQLGLLGLIGDSMQTVEDIGNLASSIMSGLQGLASYVKATIYRPSHVNNFFAQIHKRPPAYFLQLCGFRFDEYDMFDFFELRPPPSEAERRAFANAEEATADLVRDHFLHLAGQWERYRRFFHAYKHGMLVANPEEVEIVDEEENSLGGLIVWARNRPDASIGAQTTEPLEKIADDVEETGRLAIGMTEFLVEHRLAVFELISFHEDGTVSPKAGLLKGHPWRFWMRSGDIERNDIALLEQRGIRFATSLGLK
jgi:hypothetical protein